MYKSYREQHQAPGLFYPASGPFHMKLTAACNFLSLLLIVEVLAANQGSTIGIGKKRIVTPAEYAR